MVKFIYTRYKQIINVNHVILFEIIHTGDLFVISAMFHTGNSTLAEYDNESEANKAYDSLSSFLTNNATMHVM